MITELQSILNAPQPRKLTKELNPFISGTLFGQPFSDQQTSYKSIRAIIALLNNILSEHDTKLICYNIGGWITQSKNFLHKELSAAAKHLFGTNSFIQFSNYDIDLIINRLFDGKFDDLSINEKTLIAPYLTHDFYFEVNNDLFDKLLPFWNSRGVTTNFINKIRNDALVKKFFDTNQVVDNNNNLINISFVEINQLLHIAQNIDNKNVAIIYALVAMATTSVRIKNMPEGLINQIIATAKRYNLSSGGQLNANNYSDLLKLETPKFLYNIPGIFNSIITVGALELIGNNTDKIDNLSFLESLYDQFLKYHPRLFTANQSKNIQQRINFLKDKNNNMSDKFIYNPAKSVGDWFNQINTNVYDLRDAPIKGGNNFKKIKAIYIGLLFDKHRALDSIEFKNLITYLSNFCIDPSKIRNNLNAFLCLDSLEEEKLIQTYNDLCQNFQQDIIDYLPLDVAKKITSAISKQNNKTTKQTMNTNKGAKKMDTANNEDTTFMDQMKEKGALALRRSTSRVVTKNVKRALLKAMEKKGQSSEAIAMASALLDSEVGTAMVSMVLGLLMQNVPIPGFQDNDQVKKMASEFQVEGMSVGMEMVMGVVTDDLLPAITESLAPIQNMAAVEPEKSRVVANTNTPKVRAHVDEEHDEEHAETESTKRKSK